MTMRDYIIGEVAEDHADGLLTRREALRRLTLMGLTVTSASALLAACGGDDDGDDSGATSTTAARPSASSTVAGGAAGQGEAIRIKGRQGAELHAALAAPAGKAKAGILVIHENRGLTPHFFSFVGRLAAAGYTALCVDLVSAEGGTAKLGEAATQAALTNAGEDRLIEDLRAGLDELERRVPDGKLGVVGFCFGGGMTWELLDEGEARVAAAVPFYGTTPENPNFRGATAAVLGIYGELDTRVNGTRPAAEAALKDAGLEYEIRTFPGADHAFFNDTGPRYNAEAARDANTAMLAWFEQHLT